VDSLAYLNQIQAVAFRQTKGKFDEFSLAAWLRCGELDAQKQTVKTFDKKALREVLAEIKNLTSCSGDF
jgi:hypothetical protein